MTNIVDILALATARFLIALMRYTPRSIGLAIARFCVSCLRISMPRSKGVGLRNLEIVFPEKSTKEREEILERSFDVLARHLYSFALLPTISADQAKSMFNFDSVASFFEEVGTHNTGVGVLVPTIHFGNFELLVYVQALLCKPISILARGFGLRRVDSWWNSRREKCGNEIFNRKGGYREIVSRLKNGQDVTLLCDQNVKANHATFVDFFGIKAATTKAVGLAALRTGARVVFVTSVEFEPGHYKVILREIPNPQTEQGTPSEKIEAFTLKLHKIIEEVIYEYPEHWFWIHRRWKTRPSGEPETIY